MLDFRYLPAFFAVAETGNFTAAGKRLFIATSAVSRQIQLLEESCGLQLFFRSPKETKLTEAGHKLFEEMRHFQAATNQIVKGQAIPSLKVGALQGVLRHWLLGVVLEEPFFEKLNLSIHVANLSELLALLGAGKLDATFFSFAEQTEIPASMNVYALFPEDLVLISKKKLSPKEVDRETWICFAENGWLTQYRGHAPERYLIINDMASIVELVGKGRGIAIVPSYMVGNRRDLHRQKLKEFSAKSICLVTRRFEREPQTITDFLALLRRRSPGWKQIQ